MYGHEQECTDENLHVKVDLQEKERRNFGALLLSIQWKAGNFDSRRLQSHSPVCTYMSSLRES